MEKILICKDEKSHKFWNIKVQNKQYTVTYGKVDTAGRTQEKTFDSAKKALAEAEKQIASKLKKGYKDVSSLADANPVIQVSKTITSTYSVPVLPKNRLDKMGISKDTLEALSLAYEETMNQSEYGAYNIKYAGFEYLCEDNKYNWVFNDIRGKSKAYHAANLGYSSDIDIHPTKLNGKLTDWGIDIKQKPLELLVSPVKLLQRYARLYDLYKNNTPGQTVYLGEPEASTKAYQKEKTAFVEDPYLALYWLNHFGASLDPRYDEVVQLIEENNLVEKLEILKEPLAFFEKSDAFYDIKIRGLSHLDLEHLFLKRRSYVVYSEHSYKNFKPENLNLWWKSISIYPKVEENLIVRMRWLRNNLHKCNMWGEFDELIKEEDKNIPLLSYIFACNPNTSKKEKTNYADIFSNELFKYKNQFKTDHKRSFGAIMLWDVRTFVSDKEILKKAAKFYFKGKKKEKEFLAIQAI